MIVTAFLPLIVPFTPMHSANVVMRIGADDFVPDMERRAIMNNLLLAATGVPTLWMLGGFLYFLVPPGGNDADRMGIAALDANGDKVKEAAWVRQHPFPDRALVQGLKGDAHYLIPRSDGTLEKYIRI